MKTAKANKAIRTHSQYTAVDYAYLSKKGYTNAEIIKIWNRDAAAGKEPATYYAEIPDVVGCLNK